MLHYFSKGKIFLRFPNLGNKYVLTYFLMKKQVIPHLTTAIISQIKKGKLDLTYPLQIDIGESE